MLVAIQVIVVLTLVFSWPAASKSASLERMLRERHPEVWKQLQKPSRWREVARFGPRLAAFVRGGEFQRLSDPEIARCARQLRIVQRIFAAGFFTTIVLVLLSAIAASVRS